MRSSRTIHVISAHAEGEVGDVIVGGVIPPPGETLWAQRSFIARDRTLRDFVLNEPRGGVFRHVNLLVPPKHPEADAAFIIMEPEDTPPMSGSNSICVATVLLDGGLIPMQEPETRLTLEAPGGLVRVRAECRNGKAERIFVRNLPSFADRLDRPLEVPGLGTLRVDTAYGGDSLVFADAAALGLEIVKAEARDIARLGVVITNAANEQLGFAHPECPDWNHISFCGFCGPLSRNWYLPDRQVGGCDSARQSGPITHRYRGFGKNGGDGGTGTDAEGTDLRGCVDHRIALHRPDRGRGATGAAPGNRA